MRLTKELIESYSHLPDVAGEGMLFAFSGLDGPTESRSNFVLTMHNHPYDFLVQTEIRHQLRLRCPLPGKTLAAVGDVFAVAFGSDVLLVTFSAWHSVVGQFPMGCHVELFNEGDGFATHLSRCDTQDAHLSLSIADGHFCLAFGSSAAEAQARGLQGLQADLGAIVLERLAQYPLLQALPDAAQDRFLKKCFSVMKVNTLASEGVFSQAWSTPDRVPHRDLWLWDSVFHSLALNQVDSALSWDFLKSVLDQQNANGMISHQVKVNGWKSAITQPPILAWGVWENYLVRKELSALAYAADRLADYLGWNCEHRDQNRNGLLEWFIEENEQCRSGESGMDNSQRFDEALLLDAVDFSTFVALDMGYLGKIYAELGNEVEARRWEEKSKNLSGILHDCLWNVELGFYCDRKLDGCFSSVEAVTGFLPLLLDDFPIERVPFLMAALYDSDRFGAVCPIPSVALRTPAWSTDMWRGATWINMNYLIVLGLEKQGLPQAASELRTRTLEMVQKYYEQDGVIYEFYDAMDQRSPAACDRKGPREKPYDFRRKMDSIRDYHWSAALCFVMLMDESQPRP